MIIALYKSKKDLEKEIGNRLLFCETHVQHGSDYRSTGKFIVYGNPKFVKNADHFYAIVGMENDIIESVS